MDKNPMDAFKRQMKGETVRVLFHLLTKEIDFQPTMKPNEFWTRIKAAMDDEQQAYVDMMPAFNPPEMNKKEAKDGGEVKEDTVKDSGQLELFPEDLEDDESRVSVSN